MLLKRITIQSSRLLELKNFYGSILDLEVAEESATRVSLQIGQSILIIEEKKKEEAFYHFAFNIPANKIHEAREWLKKKKVELLWMEDYKSDIADFVNWRAKSVYFFDPAGNIIELIARFDLNNASSEKFSSKQFLSISEIGLVFPEEQIDEQVHIIMKQCGLAYFLKQPPMQKFKVLGDDDGLFIFVTDKRNWYPTNKPSAIFPLEILIENNGKVELVSY